MGSINVTAIDVDALLVAFRRIDELAARGVYVIIDTDSSKARQWDVTFEQGSVAYSACASTFHEAVRLAADKVPV